MKTTATIPTRIDLLGGTLDLYPIYDCLDNPATLNLGVTASAEVTVEDAVGLAIESVDQKQKLNFKSLSQLDRDSLPLLTRLVLSIWQEDWPLFHLKTKARSPAGAGLGGSSALAVAVAGTLFRHAEKKGLAKVPEEAALVDLVKSVETRLIHCPAGCQDYWGALRGGLNLIRFGSGNPIVKTLKGSFLNELGERLILCYSGVARDSGMNNWQIFKSFFDRDKSLIGQLQDIADLANEACIEAESHNVGSMITLSKKEWQLRKALWPAIVTSETAAIEKITLENGGHLARVCGAGGGGVVAILCEPDLREKISAALVAEDFQILPAVAAEKGLTFDEV